MAVVTCLNCGTKNRVDEGAARRLQPVCGKCGAALNVTAGAAETAKPRTVTDATFAGDVLGVRGVPVLLDCWAPWCGPCRMVSPALEQLATERAGRLKLVKVDVDKAPAISQRFGVQAVPTLLVLDHGEVLARQAGAAPVAALRNWLDQALSADSAKEARS